MRKAIRWTKFLFALAMACGVGASGVHAALPAVKALVGSQISPTDADSYYTNLSGAHTNGLCTLTQATLGTTMCNLPRATAIQELARTLSRNGALSSDQFATNVYEYIYKNIDTEFRYGLSKGAFGTLLDQSGTPFDQAHLMAELLKEGMADYPGSYSGMAPTFQVGTVKLDGTAFANWTGLSNAQAACQFLVNGGIPVLVNDQSSASGCSSVSGNVGSVVMSHIWLQVVTSAGTKLYDPSYKNYIQKQGINLVGAMACGSGNSPCGAAVEAAAIPSGHTGTDPVSNAYYVDGVNYSGSNSVTSTLSNFAQNLQHYIEGHMPAAQISDVVGGSVIDPSSMPVPGATLPYDPVPKGLHSWNGDIPDPYRSRINIHLDSINTWLYADETYGYWIYVGNEIDSSGNFYETLFFEREKGTSAPNTPNLSISCYHGTQGCGFVPTNEIVPLVSTKQTQAPSYPDTISLQVDHPYAANSGTYGDDILANSYLISPASGLGQIAWEFANGYPIYIVQSWGSVGRGYLERMSAMAEDKQNTDVGPDRMLQGASLMIPSNSYEAPLVNTSIPSTAATWLSEAAMARSTIDAINQTRTQDHHIFGAVIDESLPTGSKGSAISLDAVGSLSVVSKTANTVDPQAAFNSEAAAYDALEGSSIEQTTDTPTGGNSIRTMSMGSAGRFYQATPGNIGALLTEIGALYHSTTPYGPTAVIDGYLQSASPVFNMVLPRDPPSGMNDSAAPLLAYSLDGSSIAYITVTGLKGAVANILAPDPVDAAVGTTTKTQSNKPLSFQVDVGSGGLDMTAAPDLTTGAGSFPDSLAYQRSYNSKQHPSPTCFEDVWNPNSLTLSAWACVDPPGRRSMLGWTDNYQIDASFSNDGARGLGQDNALDASAAIAALYAFRDLNQTQNFQNYLTTLFAAAWLEDSLGANGVVINRPPSTDTFIRLPDGRYNPRPGTKASLAQTGARVKELLNSGNGSVIGWSYDYTGISLSETFYDGSALNFSLNDLPIAHDEIQHPIPWLNRFKPDTWTFTGGMAVNFAYTAINDPQGKLYDSRSQQNVPAHTLYVLSSVSNSRSRSLTFANDPNASSDPDGYTMGWKISDETSRSVSVRSNNGSMRDSFGTKIIGADLGLTFLAFDRLDDYSSNSQARLSKIYLPLDRTNAFLTFDWDGLRRVKDVVDGNSQKTNYFPAFASVERDARGEILDALGNATTDYFDLNGQLLSSADPLGRITSDQYDGIGRLVETLFPEGNYDQFAYDVRSNMLSTTHYPKPGSAEATAGQTIVTSTTYEEGPGVFICTNLTICNRPLKDEDARGFYTNYTWNTATGLLTKIVSGLNSTGHCQLTGTTVCPETDLGYTLLAGVRLLTSKTRKISSAASTETDFGYDNTNKYVLKTATVDAGTGGLGLATGFVFDAVGNLIEVDTPRTDDSHFLWDGSNRRPIMSIKPDPDGNGTLLRRAMRYDYDANGNLTGIDRGTVTDASGSNFVITASEVIGYDAAGNKTQDTQTAPGLTTPFNVTQYSYDADNRPLCTAVRMIPASYGGLSGSNVCTPTTGYPEPYGDDRITELIYDAAGQKRQEVRAFGVTNMTQTYETFDYTANGKPKAVADSDAALPIGSYTLDASQPYPHQTNYAYDGFDRLATTTFADGSYEQVPFNGYDAAGNILTKSNRARQTLTFTYDALGRASTKVLPAVAGVSAADTVTWGYDLLDEVTSLSDTLGNTLTNTYDGAKRQTTAARHAPGQGGTQTLTYQYDADGNRTAVIWPDNYCAAYSYDNAGRAGLAQEGTFAGGTCTTGATLATFGYDNLDNLADLHYGATLADVSLSWQTNGDLLTVAHNYTSSTDVSYNDTYSPAHQIMTSTVNNVSYVSVPGTYTNNYAAANGLNQYTAVNGGGANGHDCAGHAEQFSYDCNGNLTSDGVFAFAYDPENRLMTATSSGVSASYAYDPLGRRSAKTVNGVATYFLDSGGDEVGEYSSTGTLLRRYVPGLVVDHPLAMIDYTKAGNPETYFHQDKTGSVVAMSDTSGNVAEGPYTYDPYGAPSSAAGVPYKFDGMRYDTETGCYYDRARYYCPGIGRFLQTDSMEYDDDIDWYSFVGEDPTDKTDPDGQQELVPCPPPEMVCPMPSPPPPPAHGVETVVAKPKPKFTLPDWSQVPIFGAFFDASTYRNMASAIKCSTGDCTSRDVQNLASTRGAQFITNTIDKTKERKKKEAKRQFRTNSGFRNWFHKNFKGGPGGQGIPAGDRRNPDLDDDEILDAWEEYQQK